MRVGLYGGELLVGFFGTKLAAILRDTFHELSSRTK